MPRKYLIILLAFLLLICCSTGLYLGFMPSTQLLPAGKGVPNREIVFWDGPGTLGFVNADGDGYITRTVKVKEGPLLYLYHWASPSLESEITWSANGQYLVAKLGLYHVGGGIPVLISNEGDFVYCPFEKAPFGQGRFWVNSETEVLAVDKVDERNRVVVFDMEACVVRSVLFDKSTSEGRILAAALSGQGQLAVSQYIQGKGKELLVRDLSTLQQWTMANGEESAWARDGEWLAYVVRDEGLYIVRKDGSGVRRLVDNRWVSSPSWSPDGKWLVYTRMREGDMGGGIYKVLVSSGAESKILDDGEYPNWRWDDDVR